LKDKATKKSFLVKVSISSFTFMGCHYLLHRIWPFKLRLIDLSTLSLQNERGKKSIVSTLKSQKIWKIRLQKIISCHHLRSCDVMINFVKFYQIDRTVSSFISKWNRLKNQWPAFLKAKKLGRWSCRKISRSVKVSISSFTFMRCHNLLYRILPFELRLIELSIHFIQNLFHLHERFWRLPNL